MYLQAERQGAAAVALPPALQDKGEPAAAAAPVIVNGSMQPTLEQQNL